MSYHSSHAKRGIFSALAVVALAVAAGNAQAITLDFNGQATGPFGLITEQGFNFAFVNFGDQQAVRNIGPGDNALFDSNRSNLFGAGVTVSRADGALFDLLSFDLINLGNTLDIANISGGFVNGTRFITSPGTRITISQTLMGISSFSLNIISLTSFTFTDYGIDNIVVQLTTPPANGVPEPITATLGLMGLGVLGIATRRRA